MNDDMNPLCSQQILGVRGVLVPHQTHILEAEPADGGRE